jgi:hypothetical protein
MWCVAEIDEQSIVHGQPARSDCQTRFRVQTPPNREYFLFRQSPRHSAEKGMNSERR